MQIRMHTSPKLRRVSKPIDKITADVRKLAKKMKRYVEKQVHCVGLAAPQIGKNIRLIVARLNLEDDEGTSRSIVEVLVNPEIIHASDDYHTANEGCLSCPGYEVAMSRPYRVVVEYRDLSGQRCVMNLVDMEARIIQHEIDHLDGKLIIDKETWTS
jgi:peptide deformylase